MNLGELRERVERFAREPTPDRGRAAEAVAELLDALEQGLVRAADPDGNSWRVQRWVKEGILLAFRIGEDVESEDGPIFRFRDRDTLPPRVPWSPGRRVRIVPGGTTVRRGAFVSDGVVVMPPAYLNVGCWVGPGTMIDSHALVGSCAQVGARVHLSAAAQVGGVLEPIGALPVVVGDDVFVGGGAGIYEGTHVEARAVLGAGVILARSVPLFDLVRGSVYRASGDAPLVVPAGAVVVPGARRVAGEFAKRHGISLQAPIIVKYRDESTDAASALEGALR